MSKGTRVRSFRLSDGAAKRLIEWGKANLQTDNLSTIVRHLIFATIGDEDKQEK